MTPAMTDLFPLILILGRILMGLLFVATGVRCAFGLPEFAGALEVRGLPRPRLILMAASLFQVVAGAFLMLGYEVEVAATILMTLTVCGSALLLAAWRRRGMEAGQLRGLWLANIAIIGGLLITATQAGSV